MLAYRKALRAAEIIFALYESVPCHERIELPPDGVEDNPLVTMPDGGGLDRRRPGRQ